MAQISASVQTHALTWNWSLAARRKLVHWAAINTQ